jgi:hypothetical protein
MSREKEGKFLPKLVTSVNRIEYDFDEKVGAVYMPESYCTDMHGAIEFFKKIDSRVRQVQTFSGDVADIVYWLDDEKKWNANFPLTHPIAIARARRAEAEASSASNTA